ncbi:hypothetical protein BC829DRAFT_25626 [Chytridium lagenaria]|nr:hypothetical protein BC829DRAFT_25626 [Chytridium lagenaria]
MTSSEFVITSEGSLLYFPIYRNYWLTMRKHRTKRFTKTPKSETKPKLLIHSVPLFFPPHMCKVHHLNSHTKRVKRQPSLFLCRHKVELQFRTFCFLFKDNSQSMRIWLFLKNNRLRIF